MSIKVGVVGLGAFSHQFIPLFLAHPGVEEVVLCDLDPEKRREKCELHSVKRSCDSLDALCDTDVDAVAIFTQNWMHGPQSVQALRAGKDVYSAVPAAQDLAEVQDLVEAVEQTGRIYMMGETSVYYPCTIYCQQRYQAGDFGRVVYVESEYLHDYDHGLYEVRKWRAGDRWREFGGDPPMFYPTHSISIPVHILGERMTCVSCQGFVDSHEDGLYREDVNRFGNVFSDEIALFRTSGGTSVRAMECRRIGHPGEVRCSVFGTEGCYEEQLDSKIWTTKQIGPEHIESLHEMLDVREDAKKLGPEQSHYNRSVAPIHPTDRLPDSFEGLHNGHHGSHQFLIDDFVRACLTRKHPPCNVWQAARYFVPGLIAHESAKRGGELLEIPDFGDGPDTSGWPPAI
jgi:predicted dehydrogenase